MPRQTGRAAMAAWSTMITGTLLAAGCTVPSPVPAPTAAIQAQPPQPPLDVRLARLASRLATRMPGTNMISAPPGACGAMDAPVVHLVVPEPVLFATASDQPEPDAPRTLDDIAALTRQQVPDAAVTVLGHTDSVGSDAYNMDLSQRRAVTVLHAMADRGLDPNRLTAVAIGKRQPIADNLMAEGRARNRRVEFLVSRCLAANLAVVAAAPRDRALLAPEDTPNQPVEVLRLDPAGAYGMIPLTDLALRAPEPGQPVALPTAAPARPSAPSPPAALARPAPAPHYQPRVLSPEVQRNPLGPAVPF